MGPLGVNPLSLYGVHQSSLIARERLVAEEVHDRRPGPPAGESAAPADGCPGRGAFRYPVPSGGDSLASPPRHDCSPDEHHNRGELQEPDATYETHHGC